MNGSLKKVLPACLAALMANPLVGEAGTVRVYAEGAVPNPLVVARVLGASMPGKSTSPVRRTRGWGVVKDSEADFGSLTDSGQDLNETEIRMRAADAIGGWREKIALLGSGFQEASHGVSTEQASRSTVSNAAERPTALAVRVGFGVSSSTLSPRSALPLDAIAKGIKLAGFERKILVEGHTDASGSAPLNQRLAFRRAEAVRQYLIDKHGIPADALVAVGMGSKEPLNPLNRYAAENRRVQFRPIQA